MSIKYTKREKDERGISLFYFALASHPYLLSVYFTLAVLIAWAYGSLESSSALGVAFIVSVLVFLGRVLIPWFLKQVARKKISHLQKNSKAFVASPEFLEKLKKTCEELGRKNVPKIFESMEQDFLVCALTDGLDDYIFISSDIINILDGEEGMFIILQALMHIVNEDTNLKAQLDHFLKKLKTPKAIERAYHKVYKAIFYWTDHLADFDALLLSQVKQKALLVLEKLANAGGKKSRHPYSWANDDIHLHLRKRSSLLKEAAVKHKLVD
jgi:hypothetical protein